MTTNRQPDSKKAGAKASKQNSAPSSIEPSVAPAPDQPVPNPGVQPAYLDYLQARKGLATAFRGRQLYDKQAYDDSQRCYQSYEQAIETAFKTRQKAEREALAIYRSAVDSAVEKAAQEYRERMRAASTQCKKTTDDSWKASMQTSGAMADIFNNDQTLPQLDSSRSSSPVKNVVASFGRGLVVVKDGTVSLAGRTGNSVKRLFLGNSRPAKDRAIDAHA
jgi:hypothetical protein